MTGRRPTCWRCGLPGAGARPIEPEPLSAPRPASRLSRRPSRPDTTRPRPSPLPPPRPGHQGGADGPLQPATRGTTSPCQPAFLPHPEFCRLRGSPQSEHFPAPASPPPPPPRSPEGMCELTGRAPLSWEGTHVCLRCCLRVESSFQGTCSPPGAPGTSGSRLWST